MKVQLVPLVLMVQTAVTAPTARTVHRDLKVNKAKLAMTEAMAATELVGSEDLKVQLVPLVSLVLMAVTVHRESMVATV